MNAQPASMASIIKATAEKYGITTAQIIGRQHTYRDARGEALYLCYATGRFSSVQLGIHFDDRHHTSVLHAIRTYEREALGLPVKLKGRKPAEPVKRAGDSMILTMRGNQDGIRFGSIRVQGFNRGFFHDRLNGTVRLYTRDNGEGRREDRSESRKAVAKAMLDAAWAMERGA